MSENRNPARAVSARGIAWLCASALWLCALLAQVRGQGTIQPLHIAFDGPPAVPLGASISYRMYDEAGMSFTPIAGQGTFSRVGAGYPGDPQNGTAYLRAAFTQSLGFSFTNGSAFGLVSVDLAEYSTAFAQPITVHFVGYRFDGSTVTADLVTDGIIDGTGPLADFETFTFGKEFSGLTRVEIPTWAWSLDNLYVSVPEPGSGFLFFMGGVLALAVRRRRR